MTPWYLIHGAASTRLTWTPQLRVLHPVKRAELPPLEDVAIEKLLEEWADWCLSDMSRPSIVMGHSMGGAIAQIMALRAPNMVRGLVLVGTGPRLPVSGALLETLRTNPTQALERVARWSLSRTPNPTLLARSLEQATHVDPDRAYREFLACSTFNKADQLQSIHSFKALIAADQDRMTPASLVEEFRTAWPEAPLFTIQDAGHMMMLERPKQFNAILGQIAELIEPQGRSER